MEKIRVAVVGVGHLGQHHARNYSEMKDSVDLVGVVDVDRKAATRFADKFRTQALFDYKMLIGRVDAVSIVVPTTRHYQVAKEFIAAGVHVLIEKPITTTVAEARELIELAREKHVVLQVGHIERFNPAIVKLQEILTNPGFIESHRLGPSDPRVRDVGVVLDLMIPRHRHCAAGRARADRVDRRHGVPILSDREDIANARIKLPTAARPT